MAAEKHESPGPCYFDTLSKSFPHILEKIFFSMDYESFKNCLEVSNGWKCVLTSKRYQTVGKSVFTKEILKDGAKLHLVAEEGNMDEVRKLLASGMVDVDFKDDNESTPLHKSAKEGHTEVSQFLIERGADPNFTETNASFFLANLHVSFLSQTYP